MVEGRIKFIFSGLCFIARYESIEKRLSLRLLGDIPWREFEIPMMSFSFRMTVKAPKTDIKTSN